MANQALKRTGCNGGDSRKSFYIIESDQAQPAYLSPLGIKVDMFADLIDKNINAPEVVKIFSTYEVSAIKDTYGGLNIYDYPSHGICFYFNEENTLITIFLYSAGRDDHSQYTGKLPHELSFNDNRDSVFNLLGPPENFGAKWDRYYFETHYVHLEYAANQRISLVTIMSPSFTETAR